MPKKLTQEDFIQRAKAVHGDKYDYSLVNYINAHTKIKIICKEHGIFKQIPNNHTSKKFGCQLCGYDKIWNIRGKITTKDFIKRAIKLHNNLYDYSLVEYIHSHVKIKIICKKHGIFKQTPTNHLNRKGCPYCYNSIGETKIKQWLEEYNINFIQQKRFKDCKNKRQLPFDFYLPNHNACIEYDGQQHFKPIQFGGISIKNAINRFEKTKSNDKIKTKYCKNNNILLIRISYQELLSSIKENPLFFLTM